MKLFMWTFLSIIAFVLSAPIQYKGIAKPIDILYAIDASDDVPTNLYNHFRSIVIHDMSTKDFKKARVGILSYASEPVLQLAPKYGDKASVVANVIEKMHRPTGIRNLKNVLITIYKSEDDTRYVRPDSKRLLVLFIGGKSLYWKNENAKLFRTLFSKKGVDVIVVATEDATNDAKDLVTDPDKLITMKGIDDQSKVSVAVTVSVADPTVDDKASRDDSKLLAENESPSEMANSEQTESENNHYYENEDKSPEDVEEFLGQSAKSPQVVTDDVTEPANNGESTEDSSEPVDHDESTEVISEPGDDDESTEDNNIIEFRNAFVDSSAAIIYPEASKGVEKPLEDTAVYCNGC